MGDIEVAKLRLNRAISHLNEFKQAADIYLNTNPFGTYTETYTENGENCIRLVYKVLQPPPPILGIIAGDCINNLRAILDNLVWSLGRIYPSTDLKAKGDKLSFPICKTQTDYEKKIKQPYWMTIYKFPKVAQELIESLQPYNSTKQAHRIGILHQLWNADKHRSPDLMGGASSGVRQGFNLQQPASLSAGMYIEDGRVFGYGVIPKDGVPKDAIIELLGTSLLFHENGPASGFIVYGLLYELIQIVHDEIICKLEPIF